jgi:KUP system potassium uptake protein
MPANSGPDALRRQQAALIFGTVGIVFGDIGTSPLYALRIAFNGPQAIAPTAHNVVGVLSLVLWSLTAIVGIKYAILMLRADNRGEGGIMALLALALRGVGEGSRLRGFILYAGLIGTALFFGDAMLAPAITVMSAVEGLEVMSPRFGAAVTPLTLLALTLLFVLQRRGTHFISGVFSPIMSVWFVAIATLGLISILQSPAILSAVNPLAALGFLVEAKRQSLIVLGAVVLAVTGAEALYADLGHFGVKPIRSGWFGFVFPALALNYLGQGALLLRDPAAASNPFFLLSPDAGMVPLLGLATVTTMIASQAVISGAFSLAGQAVQMGFLPRLRIVHTAAGKVGQVYVPVVNWILLGAVCILVLRFNSSADLAGSYGVAVTGTMVVTTVLAFFVLGQVWQWGWAVSGIITGAFLVLDLAFLGANLLKVSHGGWLALLAAALMLVVMSTWKRGRELLVRRLNDRAMPLEALLARMEAEPPARVPGTAVYLTAGRRGVPQALLHNLYANKIVHERVIILTVVTRDEPRVGEAERLKVRHFGDQIYRVKLYYGFNESPDVPKGLARCAERGLDIDLAKASFFLARESLISTNRPGMARWRERLFINLSRNAESAMSSWRIPPDRVVEFGVMVEL